MEKEQVDPPCPYDLRFGCPPGCPVRDIVERAFTRASSHYGVDKAQLRQRFSNIPYQVSQDIAETSSVGHPVMDKVKQMCVRNKTSPTA